MTYSFQKITFSEVIFFFHRYLPKKLNLDGSDFWPYSPIPATDRPHNPYLQLQSDKTLILKIAKIKGKNTKPDHYLSKILFLCSILTSKQAQNLQYLPFFKASQPLQSSNSIHTGFYNSRRREAILEAIMAKTLIIHKIIPVL